MPKKPVILIIPSLNVKPGPHLEHRFELRCNYADSIAELGGLPLIFACDEGAIMQALNLADGVLITGSDPGERVPPRRLACEQKVIEAALTLDRPLLGICHGMQLIGQALGGMIVEIDDEGAHIGKRHNPYRIPDQFAHDIELKTSSRLGSWFNTTKLRVNSFHRHALIGPGDFVVAAHSVQDDVIEAIEGSDKVFCLGVQWHPEYLLSSHDSRILTEFIAAAKTRSDVNA
ncbi:MAG: gamma-glutamyl-gamma-aminobutyrate hydrolase family protein [Pseudomonadota bacterium]